MKKSICSVLVGLLLIMGVIGTRTIEVQAAINLGDLDYNLNGVIDSDDLARIKVSYLLGRYDIKYDLNKDNKIDIFDITIMTKELGKEIPIFGDDTDITSKFSDAKFMGIVYSMIRKPISSPILYSDVKDIKELNVSRNNLSNIRGIEYFTSLTKLDCSFNKLTAIDVRKNIELIELISENNQLTALDVSKNIALTKLSCSGNLLTTIDVSKNIALTKLSCSNNLLTSLDVSKNIALINFGCSFNKLTTIDVRQNKGLTFFNCSYNGITTLDVSENAGLINFFCDGNRLTTLNVSENKALSIFCCDGNRLTTLDVSKNIALSQFSCGENQLATLDVSGNTELIVLACEFNELATLYSANNGTENDWWYKTQYTDASHTATTSSLIMTIKN